MLRTMTIETREALLRDAMEILASEYASALTLDDVAARVASSRRQLQRCFAELGSGSFRECLTRIRMERAAELLASANMPVRGVARRVGYRQPAQFAKAFRRHHSCAPNEYRAAHQRQQDVAPEERARQRSRLVRMTQENPPPQPRRLDPVDLDDWWLARA